MEAQDILKAWGETITQHNLLSTATDEQRRAFIERNIRTYNRIAQERTGQQAGHNFTDRELATVLHALRKLQHPLNCIRCCEHFDEVEPLTDDEIDDLCERLNLGADADEPAKPQVGAISPKQGIQPEEQTSEAPALAAVLLEFCRDIEAVGRETTASEWPDLIVTYNKARRALAAYGGRCVSYCPHGYQGNPAACVDCKLERDTPPGTYVHQGTSEAHSPVRTASGEFYRYCATCRGWFYRHPWQVPANVAPFPGPIPENGEQAVRS